MMPIIAAPEEIVSQWITAFNGDDPHALLQFCSKDVVVHATAPVEDAPSGMDRILLSLQVYRAAFPQGRFAIESLYHQGDRLCCTWTAKGVHANPFLHFAPTHNDVTFHGTCQFRFVDNVIVEHWFDLDLYDIYVQMGALLPEPGQASPGSEPVSQRAVDEWIEALRGGELR